jgi:superfamily I DNA/RNA helicase
MRLLNNELPDDEEIEDKRLLDDIQIKKLIAEIWNDAIAEYIRLAADNARRTGRNVRLLYEKAVHYLFKTLENFTRNKTSLETLKDKKQPSRHYYPMTQQLRENGDAAKLGFPPHIYSRESSYSFFADTCVEIWEYIVKNNIRSYNIEMKKAQLQNLRIPCTVLLVDECQDLDGCQVAWIEGQKKFGTHIFLVGDSVQCIYGFRGAKSTHVMKLPDCIDVMLTKSYRFGSTIAKAANFATYAKERSPQTIGRTVPLWFSYRVEGVFVDEGVLFTKSLLLDRQQYKQITIIGSTNGCLMKVALDLLGLANLKNPGYDNANVDVINTITEIPRIHINGKGETSGMRLWSRTVKIIRTL